MGILKNGFQDTPALLAKRFSGCRIQETEKFIQDFQEGRGPGALLTTLLTALQKILNKRRSGHPGNPLKNVQSPDSTTLRKSPKKLDHSIAT